MGKTVKGGFVLETKYCKVAKAEIEIEPKFTPIYEGREQVDSRKVGYHWHTCTKASECRKCPKHKDSFE